MQIEAGHWYTKSPNSDLKISIDDFIAVEDADLESGSDSDQVEVLAITEITSDGMNVIEATPPKHHLQHYQKVDGEKFGKMKSHYSALGFYCDHGCGELLVTGGDVISLYTKTVIKAELSAFLNLLGTLQGIGKIGTAISLIKGGIDGITVKEDKVVEWFDKVVEDEDGNPACCSCGNPIEY